MNHVLWRRLFPPVRAGAVNPVLYKMLGRWQAWRMLWVAGCHYKWLVISGLVLHLQKQAAGWNWQSQGPSTVQAQIDLIAAMLIDTVIGWWTMYGFSATMTARADRNQQLLMAPCRTWDGFMCFLYRQHFCLRPQCCQEKSARCDAYPKAPIEPLGSY
jgi:hypothetical protein